jgi:hypothetical protein
MIGLPPIKYPPPQVIERLQDFIERARAGIVKPRLISFRAEYGISKNRLWELSKEHEAIGDALEQLRTLEEEYIVHGGESGSIPSPFAKFRLQQNPFNYSEKTELVMTEKRLEDFDDE